VWGLCDEDKDSAAMFNVASTSEILVAQKKEKFRIVLDKYYKIVE
jgi:hypothetical protein